MSTEFFLISMLSFTNVFFCIAFIFSRAKNKDLLDAYCKMRERYEKNLLTIQSLSVYHDTLDRKYRLLLDTYYKATGKPANTETGETK